MTKLYYDGSMWCALYGEDLQVALCGIGKNPKNAMQVFDKNYNERTLLALEEHKRGGDE